MESPNITLKFGRKKKYDIFTIIYKGKDGIVEIQTSKDKLFASLGYFQKRQDEFCNISEYYIHDEFNTKMFKEFIESVQNEEVSINENNYSDFYKLSCKYDFQEFREEIEKFMQERPDLCLIADELSNLDFSESKEENDNDDSDNDNNSIANAAKEELIAKHLDFSLQNNLLKKLPISMTIRILNSPKRQLNDHHLLFKFVTDQIRSFTNTPKTIQQGENLTLLTSSLDYCQMSEEEIEELFSISDEFGSFGPKNSEKRMKIFIHEAKESREKISELEKRIDDLVRCENENKDRITQIETEQISSLERKIEDVREEIRQIREINLNELNEKQKMNENLIKKQKEIISSNLNSINKLFEKESMNNEKMNQIENTSKSMKSVNEIESSLQTLKFLVNLSLPEKNFPNGIFQGLFSELGCNPVERGLVEINGNSYDNKYKQKLKNIINPDWDNVWLSENTENSFLDIKFNNILVKFNKYRLKVGTESGDFYFNSWIMEGTTVDNQKIIISEINNTDQIKPPESVATFSIPNDKYFCSMRITMKGKNNSQQFIMNFRNIELYGSVKIKL